MSANIRKHKEGKLYPMRILVVLAHPDDEAFGPGGTLSRYSLTGHSVRLVTMTHGEAGTLGPAKHLSRDELARLRADELRCSAVALHLSSQAIHSLPDGKLSELPADSGLEILRQEIDAFNPDALITFHFEGISGHPDHRTVSQWCLQAVQERNSGGPRLLLFGISPEMASRVVHRKLTPIPGEEITHILDVSGYLEYKLAAIRCHRSQSESWDRIRMVPGGIESYMGKEYFSQVWPTAKRQGPLNSLED